MNNTIEKGYLKIIIGILLMLFFWIINNLNKVVINDKLTIIITIVFVGVAFVSALVIGPKAYEEIQVKKIKREQNEK